MTSRSDRLAPARGPEHSARGGAHARLLAVLLALVVVAAACGFGDDDTTATPDATPGATEGDVDGEGTSGDGDGEAPAEASVDTITVGVPSLQEQYVDPHFTVGGLLFGMRWAISEGLYRQDLSSGEWVPNLATGYEVGEDGLTWTFSLRDDVLMHDGSTFTAQDQKTAIDRVLGSEDFAHLAAFRSLVTGAEVVDDTTIQITTSAPYATLVSDLHAVPPIPTGYYQEVGEEGFRDMPMAAGAFTFVSQELNSSVTYERFDDFFDPERLPNFRNLVFEIIPDESSRVAGMQTGALDIAYGLSALAAGQLESAQGVRVLESEGTGQAWVMPLDNIFPDEASPLHDVRVRRALLMAIDRESIVSSLYQGFGEVPQTVMTPATMGYDDSLELPDFDPDGAMALLEEAGASGIAITLNSYSTTSTVPHFSRLAETIAGYWNQVGLQTSLNVADANTVLPAWRARQLRGAGLIAGPVSYYDEPSRFGSSFFASDASYTTLTNAEMDDLLDRIDSAVDADERRELGGEFSRLLHEELYALPIVRVSSLVAVNDNIAEFDFLAGNPYFGPFWNLRAS
jgi:peptide/nickel transport system substrate-binding protein